MRISKLIKHLEAIRQSHGDLLVEIQNGAGDWDGVEGSTVEFSNFKGENVVCLSQHENEPTE